MTDLKIPTISYEAYSAEERKKWLNDVVVKKKGTIRATFLDLCDLFGTPMGPFDGKSQAQWTVKFDPTDDRMSIVVDIYDWKAAENVYEVTEWTVASNDYDGLDLVDELLKWSHDE